MRALRVEQQVGSVCHLYALFSREVPACGNWAHLSGPFLYRAARCQTVQAARCQTVQSSFHVQSLTSAEAATRSVQYQVHHKALNQLAAMHLA